MIQPTIRAFLIAAAGGLIFLGVAAAAPALWWLGALWVLAVAGLIAADAALSPWPSAVQVDVDAPAVAQAGRSQTVTLAISSVNVLSSLETRLQTNALFDIAQTRTPLEFDLTPNRRGEGRLEKVWLRWRGPLGLVTKQLVKPLARTVIITPDTKMVEREAINILLRHNLFGEKVQIEQGEGSEFDSLREFQNGMDTRAIDWKQTARHRTLLTREFRVEKNHSIVFAIDCGRLMSEPVGAGLSRLDHALNATLLMSFVSLKLGDRVGFYAFGANPKLKTGVISGPSAFAQLQRMTARIDYTAEETNFTFGLTELSRQLDRRTLVVVFTDFADATSAELMLNNVAALSKKHLILFVAFRDDELESLIDHEPQSADDVTRAVIADTLLRERDLVIAKLQRMGALIVDAPSDRIGAGLINQYVKIKGRNLL